MLYHTYTEKPSGDTCCLRIVTVLPEVFASAQTTVLTRGHPRRVTLPKSDCIK
jgi:hypothetical protein